jgi:hypothetical protein
MLKDLFGTPGFREKLDDILGDVDTLCNDDQSPAGEELKRAIEDLIVESYNLGINS